jgi:hypothetical protein
MHPIFFQLGWNLDGNWPIRRQNPYQHQFVNVNNNNYTCCAKMAGKEETPKCRKKTVTWTNEIIEDLIDFMEIHPIVWNVKDKSYHDKDKRKEVMQEIAEKLDLPGTYIFL